MLQVRQFANMGICQLLRIGLLANMTKCMYHNGEIGIGPRFMPFYCFYTNLMYSSANYNFIVNII